MATLIQLQDAAIEASIVVRVSGGYNPDILEDLKRRVIDMYQEVIRQRLALRLIDDELESDEDDEEEPTSGMDAHVE